MTAHLQDIEAHLADSNWLVHCEFDDRDIVIAALTAYLTATMTTKKYKILIKIFLKINQSYQ